MKLRLVRSDLTLAGGLPEYQSAVCQPEYNRRGRTTVTLAPREIPTALLDEGVRIIVEHAGGVWSGPLKSNNGGIRPDGDTDFEFVDDWGAVMDLLVPINPTEPIRPETNGSLGQATALGPLLAGTVQGQGETYAWHPADSSPEAAVKSVIRDTLAWWGITNVVVFPDQRRGTPVPLPPVGRWATLEEATEQILEQGGIGLRISQRPADSVITVDVWVPNTWRQEITAESEVLDEDGTFSRMRRPDANAVIVGGPGEGAEREFYLRRDEASIRTHGVIPAWSTTTHSIKWPEGTEDVNQVAKYLRFLDPTLGAGLEAALAAEAEQTLLEGQMTAELNVALATTDGFFFGSRRSEDGRVIERGFFLGDIVPVRLTGSKEPYRERIRGLTITDDADDGEDDTKPRFGDSNSKALPTLIGAVSELQKALRRITKTS